MKEKKTKKVTIWTHLYAWPVAIGLGLVAWRWRKAGLIRSVSLRNRIRREYLDMVDPWSSAEQDVYVPHPLIPRKNRKVYKQLGVRNIRHRKSMIEMLIKSGRAREAK
ncbi:MAG: hypothetical protein KDK37_12280 [Leptospiraceae bacterium]|nr:hypothetical protein [Leptospiraceae bacterium]